MDKQQIAMKLVLRELGQDVDMTLFLDRFTLQKTIYLAQALDINLGYYFNWYLYGPYCSSLATDGFAVQEEIRALGEDESSRWHLDPQTKKKLNRIKELFNIHDKKALAKKLELLASVHFLISRKKMNRGQTQDIASTLQRFGKPFTDQDVNGALKELNEYGFSCS